MKCFVDDNGSILNSSTSEWSDSEVLFHPNGNTLECQSIRSVRNECWDNRTSYR